MEGDKMEFSDAHKLKELYELYEQPMYRIAYAFLHNKEMAEDAVSDAFAHPLAYTAKTSAHLYMNCR